MGMRKPHRFDGGAFKGRAQLQQVGVRMPDLVVSSQLEHNIALPWWSAGCSVIPILPTNRKKPDREWKPLQSERMPRGEVERWPSNYGVAVICGKVSGGLELLELEYEWANAASLDKIHNCMSPEVRDIWDVLMDQGYSEWSPKGGVHVFYRIQDHEVPGNTKIASTYEPEGAQKSRTKAETRGEGGYSVVAPSPASCHEWNLDPWTALAGSPALIPSITWAQRCAIHAAIKQALDETPKVSTPVPQPRRELALRPPGEMTPAEDYNLRVDWADILEPIGWTLHSRNGAGLERLWTRPGKPRMDGHSASTDYMGKPGLYVWSSSADGLPVEEPLTKFFVYAHYQHHGDMMVAARDLRAQGFGTPAVRSSDATFMGDQASVEVVLPSKLNGKSVMTATSGTLRPHTFTDTGMVDLLERELEGRFRYISTRNKWMFWDGKEWKTDYQAVFLYKAVKESIQEMHRQAVASGNKELEKFGLKCMDNARIKSIISGLRMMSGDMSEFDNHPEKVNVGNGLLDLNTLELVPHAPEHMVTKTMGASFDPSATAPRFEQYLHEVLPDADTRDFLQRMVGYTLVGNPVERALTVLHGPGGTGKSRFIEILSLMMGSYGTTAAASLFQSKREAGGGPSNDLNDLRGARLASVSELDYGVRMDEALVKRLTGLDRITSRALYEENQTWMPNCVIWLATNHMFKINSDDGAIWDRVKVVTFNQKIENKDPHILEKLRQEADGIFNWMLEGLRKYRERGLAVPEVVKDAVSAHREEQDTAMQFLKESIAEGVIVVDPSQRLRCGQSFALYDRWCKDNGIRIPLGRNKFLQRLESLGYERPKTNGHNCWVGLGMGVVDF